MKLIGYLALSLVSVSLVACGNKGGDGGNAANPGQQQFNPNFLNPNGTFPGVGNQGISSIDVQDGKIVNRTFHTQRGKGSETISHDSCKPSIIGDTANNLRFARDFNTNDIELAFDVTGNLVITAHLISGDLKSGIITPANAQMASGTPTYFIEKSPPSLVISGFTLQGTPKPEFVNKILSDRGMLRRNVMRNNNGLSLNNDDGFDPNFHVGQNQNPPQVSQPRPINLTPNILFARFERGIQFNIQTARRINPQHIVDLKADSISFATESSISDSNGSTCVTDSEITIEKVLIQ